MDVQCSPPVGWKLSSFLVMSSRRFRQIYQQRIFVPYIIEGFDVQDKVHVENKRTRQKKQGQGYQCQTLFFFYLVGPGLILVDLV